MTVRPGGGSDGWLRPSKNGTSEALDCEFTVVDGPFAKRKLWQLFTLSGKTPGHAEAGEISKRSLRAFLESARGVKPDDTSETAQAARKIAGWGDFNDLRFVAQIGVRPPEGAFPAKNHIQQVITPDRQCWKQPEQIPASERKAYSAPPTNGSGAAPTANAATPTPNAPPAGAIARPGWAQ
jgi:hypothetical protein